MNMKLCRLPIPYLPCGAVWARITGTGGAYSFFCVLVQRSPSVVRPGTLLAKYYQPPRLVGVVADYYLRIRPPAFCFFFTFGRVSNSKWYR